MEGGAYPLLREKMREPVIYLQDTVRFEIMGRFGYLPTESSIHNLEYVPYFRKTPELIEKLAPVHGVEKQLEEAAHSERRREELREEAYGDKPVQVHRSDEYCINMIDTMETNVPTASMGTC